MFELEEFSIKKANEYRYTLIYNNICTDFLVRDGQIITYEDMFDYCETEYETIPSVGICKYKISDEKYTHFTIRENTYFDLNNIVEYMENKCIIIQDFSVETNNHTNKNFTPIYNNLFKIYSLGDFQTDKLKFKI